MDRTIKILYAFINGDCSSYRFFNTMGQGRVPESKLGMSSGGGMAKSKGEKGEYG